MSKVLAVVLVFAVGGCSLFAAAARRGEHHDPPECPGYGAPLADLVGTLATLGLAVVTTSALRGEGAGTGTNLVLFAFPVLYATSAVYGAKARVQCSESVSARRK